MIPLKTIKIISKSFIIFSALSLSSISIMAFLNPQSVMDLVQVELPNNDAFSSIRGVYGGVAATIVFTLIYLLLHNVKLGLGFLTLLWGFYALSRVITILVEGPLGTFGSTWLVLESIFFAIAISLFLAYKNIETTPSIR
jgi:hypothetical protein